MLQNVLSAFGLDLSARVHPFGSGLINNTWKISSGDSSFILQRINQHVFHVPQDIAENISLIGNYLKAKHPEYLFTFPVKTITGEDLFYDRENGYFRLFPFIEGSHTVDVVKTAVQAYNAAAEFGKFTSLLSGFPARSLRITIPDFHNLALRFSAFLQSLKTGDPLRIKEAQQLIRQILASEHIVKTYTAITQSDEFCTRVIHHDTKISNVLFDEKEEGLCVIDLDTVMPGYFISDVGDMMRTYLCPVSEEEGDFSKIEIREDIYKAIVSGYSQQMSNHLTGTEKKYFMYAGQFMIYMQAIRFLTDHLLGDIYYGAKYSGHNLVRAGNQLVLLERLSRLKHLA